ncbi:hypothetical protein [Sphingomonas sp. HMP6]|nr:hypothetical protein [Sphingomonas sp. HMP6]
MANLFDPSPGLKSETLDPAATGSSASIPDLADGFELHTTSGGVAQ